MKAFKGTNFKLNAKTELWNGPLSPSSTRSTLRRSVRDNFCTQIAESCVYVGWLVRACWWATRAKLLGNSAWEKRMRAG